MYPKVKDNLHKIYVGHQMCYSFDDLNLNLCAKCAIPGHSDKKCKNKNICSLCSKEHGPYNYKQKTEINKERKKPEQISY